MSTKIKSICLRREEVQALQRDGWTTVARKVKFSDEYTKGCGPGMALLAGHHATPIRDGIGLVWRPYGGSPEVPMPPDKVAEYSPFGKFGTRRAVKEPWSYDHARFYPHYPFVYKAESSPADWEISQGQVYSPESKAWFPFRWQSAQTMPLHHVRYTVEVESVAVEQREGVWHWGAVVKRVEA